MKTGPLNQTILSGAPDEFDLDYYNTYVAMSCQQMANVGATLLFSICLVFHYQ